MKFALLDTHNNSGLIKALKLDCCVVPVKGTSKTRAVEAPIREQINAIAERNVRRRQIRFPIIFNRSVIAATYRYIYRKRAISTYLHFCDELSRQNEIHALIFNGYLAPNALFDLAATQLGIDRLYVENGFFPKTLQADKSGINALSTLPRSAKFYDELPDDKIGDHWPDTLVTRKSKLKETSGEKASRALPSSYVFVPFQVPSDMQILALSPWITDMVHMYREIYALAEAFPERNFIIKEHPSFPISIQGKVRAHPRIHFFNAATTRDLILGSEAVLTVNSTVGLEAITLNKKVIVLGDAHYDIDGICMQVSDRERLHSAFKGLGQWEPNIERLRKYVRFVFNEFLLPIDRENAPENSADLLRARALKTDNYSQAIDLFGDPS